MLNTKICSKRNHGRCATGRHKPICTCQINALDLYQNVDKTSKEIAEQFHISPATLTVWAKKCGVSLRGRGRPADTRPSLTVQLLLLEAWTNTFEFAAQKFGVTKQRVGKAVKRWREWAVAEFGPRDIRSSSRQIFTKKPDRGCPRVIRPRIITFRISDLEMAELVARGSERGEAETRSPHSIARSLLMQSLQSVSCQDCSRTK